MVSRILTWLFARWIGRYILVCAVIFPINVINGVVMAWKRVTGMGDIYTLAEPLHVYFSDSGDVAVQVILINEIKQLLPNKWVVEYFYAIADAETIRSVVEPSARRIRKWRQEEGYKWSAVPGNYYVPVVADVGRGWRATKKVRIGVYDYRPYRLMSVWVGAGKDQLLTSDFRENRDENLRRAVRSNPDYLLSDGTTVMVRFERVSGRVLDAMRLQQVPGSEAMRIALGFPAAIVDFLTAPFQMAYYAAFSLFSR